MSYKIQGARFNLFLQYIVGVAFFIIMERQLSGNLSFCTVATGYWAANGMNNNGLPFRLMRSLVKDIEK